MWMWNIEVEVQNGYFYNKGQVIDSGFCGNSEAERHLGITLSVCHTFGLLITFLP